MGDNISYYDNKFLCSEHVDGIVKLWRIFRGPKSTFTQPHSRPSGRCAAGGWGQVLFQWGSTCHYWLFSVNYFRVLFFCFPIISFRIPRSDKTAPTHTQNWMIQFGPMLDSQKSIIKIMLTKTFLITLIACDWMRIVVRIEFSVKWPISGFMLSIVINATSTCDFVVILIYKRILAESFDRRKNERKR